MWESILTSQAFAVIASSAITAMGAVAVTIISKKRAQSNRVRSINDFAGYKEYAQHLREEFKAFKVETEKTNRKFEERILELEKDLDEANKISQQRRSRLLAISRRFNVDVSDVV